MGPPKVLIVDDDAVIRSLLRHTLGSESYLLLEAVDGRQAMELVERERPDLILLDIMMPVMNGLAVLRRLKAEDRTRDIPVIIITALTSETDVATSLEDGAIDHISKPFSELIVRTRVRAALRGRVAVAAVPPAVKCGRRIGFIGAKGGVGVSTAVVNTALTMMSPQRSVVIAELRPYPGTLATQLGLPPVRHVATLLDLPPGKVDAAAVRKCLTLHRSGLQVLLAPPQVDEQRDLAAQQAEGILNAAAEVADFVLVDLPSAPSRATRTVLRSCTFVVVTVELEATCLAAAKSLLEAIAAWEIDTDSVGALLVLHHASAGTTITVKHALTLVDCGLIGVIPPAGEANLVSLKSAKPLVFSSPDSVVAMAYTELGARLMADNVATMKLKL